MTFVLDNIWHFAGTIILMAVFFGGVMAVVETWRGSARGSDGHGDAGAQACQRESGHSGPCNGYPRDDCLAVAKVYASPNERATREVLGKKN